jgi:hypothetical protein
MNRILFVLVTLLILTTAVFGQSQPRIATLVQQKMCAEQAAKVFHESEPDGSWSFTNHYDASANICYLMKSRFDVNTQGTTATTTVLHDVVDAFEGREYARFAQVIVNGDHSSSSVVECYARQTECKANYKFLELVDKYFGIGY